MYLLKVDDSIEDNSFLNETVAQLEKDFLMIGVNFDIPKPVLCYSSLFNFTFNLVYALNEKDSQKILNLLYRIDLSEEIVKKELKQTESRKHKTHWLMHWKLMSLIENLMVSFRKD